TSVSILTHEPQSQISAGKKVESQSEVVDFKAMNYTEFIPIVIKALQEISQKNTTLEQENEQLKSEYKKLETQIAELKQLINQNAKTASSSALAQNFPNPFFKSTTISFSIPKLAGTASIV